VIKPNEVIIEVHETADGHLTVREQGTVIGTFARASLAAACWASEVRERKRLQKLISQFSGTLHALTPDQVNPAKIRQLATELTEAADIK
jgi:hypothetical protein